MRILTIIIIVFFIISAQIKAQNQNYDPARIYKAMNKGRNGENLKIGVIGGSITQGYAASTTSKRWANLMTDWWETAFESSNVELINAGWGGTGSDIGAHRVYDDLLSQHPDFIVVEFSVNDVEGDLAKKMMEGLVQQVLTAENSPGLAILMLKQDNGTTAAASHKPVAEHYSVPYVSFADLIDDKVTGDGVELSSIFVDGLHPNDAGMAYIAGFVTDMLDSLYATLPAEDQLPDINTTLPTPLVTDIYSSAYQYFTNNIVQLSNNGWEWNKDGWTAESAGSEISFKQKGNAVSLIFTQNNGGDRGRAEVWVDDGEKLIIDAYMTDDWGTKFAYALVAEDLTDGEHILHVKVISESSSTGSKVHIERIITAGNVGTAAPIAVTSEQQKGVVGFSLDFNGYESFDPEGDLIDSYQWSISEKPAGSTADITDADKANASFTPDVGGDYVIELLVGSGEESSVPARKKLSIRDSNAKPIAVPGNDTISDLNNRFRFNGTKSYDDDGDPLTYSWVLESIPDGSEMELMGADTGEPQCKFDINGDYLFSLVVNDSIENSEKAYITVEGREGYVVGVKELKNNLDWVKIYPNPVTDKLNINYYMKNNKPVNISIIDLQGKLFATYSFKRNEVGLNSQTINFESLSINEGIYIVKIISNSELRSLKMNYCQ